MSNVTDVIVTCSLSDEDKFGSVNRWFMDTRDNDCYCGRLQEAQYNGNRVLQCKIWVGAFKNFDHESFLEYLRTSVTWDDPDAVQVFMQFEHSEHGFERVEWRR